MDLEKLNYQLDESLIAKTPASPRDTSRLMYVQRKTEEITHHHFCDLDSLLNSGDVLVINNSKVFPARLIGKKQTGGEVEILLTKSIGGDTWEALHKGKLKKDDIVYFEEGSAIVLKKNELTVELGINHGDMDFFTWIGKHGHTPLPPYIETTTNEKVIRRQYQTVYAKDRGSVAAPTAGLHFTDSLIKRLIKKGVDIHPVTLHVGIGTFMPIKTEDITKHTMHSEMYHIDTEVMEKLNKCKKEKRRIIAVGTTSLRTLESASNKHGVLQKSLSTGSTNIYVYPPYKMKFVDGLITNFHLPKTTLIALVSAFVSYPNTKSHFRSFNQTLMGHAYEIAQDKQYRLFSYGDSCLIV